VEAAMGEPLEFPLRVRFAECDPQGVVFNAHYLAWFDISITELFRAAFGSYQSMIDRGWDVMVAEANLRYLSPARSDDEVRMAISVGRLGTTSLPTHHRVWRGQELLVEGTLRHVGVNTETYRKAPIPESAREALAPWTVEPG
jgi:acyl-CoA thioester hydrolase